MTSDNQEVGLEAAIL